MPGNLTWSIDIGPACNQNSQALSLDLVTIDLLRQDNSQGGGGPPDTWPVVATAAPDANGVFVFENLTTPANYALRLNQPEFADFAYAVDSTEFELQSGQTITLVLPLVTTVKHNLMNPNTPWSMGDNPPAAALDNDTGEIVLTSNLGFAVLDTERGTLDLLHSDNFFIGWEEAAQGMPNQGPRVLALAPLTQIAWILCPDRLIKVDRTLFTNPDLSETLDLDLLATRVAAGNKFQFHMLPNPTGVFPQQPQWTGDVYLSPDEKILYASSSNAGVMVFDLDTMQVVRVILGHIMGYNPLSNHLFITNGDYGQANSTDLLVVNASTFLEVNSAAIQNVVGVAAMPDSSNTVVIRSMLSTSDVKVPFVVVVDASGSVVTDQRARDYLGIDYDPGVGAPSFDLTGEYFMIGSSAFRVRAGGGFDAVEVGVPPGNNFLQRMQCNNRRAVDPANLIEIWYAGMCPESNAVGLISLDQTSVPVAVRPGVPNRSVLLDRTRGRAIFGGFDRVVLVHYADPSASASEELTDLTAVVAPFTQPGAPCSSALACSGTELCAGATDTAYTGQCMANPRLPYLPYCGGFRDAVCDDDFSCELINATNPNSVGECVGFADRDFANSGPVCSVGDPCPTGMRCGAGGRCEPKVCLRDSDCAAYSGEICGQVTVLGRVCVLPGPLVDGAACFDSAECQHGACVGIVSAAAMGDSAVLHGINGLLACTTPCYENADCPAGGQCFAEQIWMPNGNNNGFSQLWNSQRLQVMPYCRPPNQEPIAECATCTADQLCINDSQPMGPHCQFGFNPAVFVAATPQPTMVCLPPAELCDNQWGQCGGFMTCRYPCQRNVDCTVFTSECVAGQCAVGSPCEMRCTSDQVCGQFNFNHPFCVTADACASDADCGGAVGSCLFNTCSGPPTVCQRTSDCAAGQECVEWNWTDGQPYHCLPALCGCSGADVGEMVCDTNSYTCAKTCTTAADCSSGEECVGSQWQGFRCGPAQCGCTGARASEMVCDQQQVPAKCVLPQRCTDVPCDGTSDVQCITTAPDPIPPSCMCPNCLWDVMCPVPNPTATCPTGFACMDLGTGGLPPRIGQRCQCNATECQTP